jgi:Ras-related protein Rab-1A
VYDITDKQSFKDVEIWLAEIDKLANENVVKLLEAKKCDMEQ